MDFGAISRLILEWSDIIGLSSLKLDGTLLSWALSTNSKLLQATYPSPTTALDVVLITEPTLTTVRPRCFIRPGDFSISRYGERQQASPSTTAAAKSTEPASVQLLFPNLVSPVDVGENDYEYDPEADASFVSFISDTSSALSSTAEEERSEDEGTGDEEEDGEDEEESDAPSSIAHVDEEEEEQESEQDFNEENADQGGSVVLEDDTTPKLSTTSLCASLNLPQKTRRTFEPAHVQCAWPWHQL
ncbi:hypothetical protein M407DRAFT_26577 [Tulasnella calospora MUT 4182]|uniref:Uncharacterized protein n=1 Tax=Tulasnella calospora MUT 4182 TaxID=1051891 RepID=A0A0C3Q4N6_9AGAM|nr:hypothetical protein M407DRAFT_26577 [Tulasnella calospora MUT 4182]